MKEIYLMRHSEVLKPFNLSNDDSLQIQNEKWPLTIAGEELAKEKSNQEIFKDFDIVISSNYVRALSTAKYFAKDKVIVDKNFDERRFGINSWEEKPLDFEKKQFSDFDYKLKDGESLNEVAARQYKALSNILNEYPNKKILIVGHSTAFTSLFSKWCTIDFTEYRFNNKKFFEGNWKYCESFKLTFNDNNELIDIINII